MVTLTLLSTQAYGLVPAEVLYLDTVREHLPETNREDSTFLVSNSVRDGLVLIKPSKSFEAALDCDGKVSVKNKALFGKNSNGEQLDLILNKDAILSMPTNVSKCVLTYWEQTDPSEVGIVTLKKDEDRFEFLKEYNNWSESCNYNSNGVSGIQTQLLSNEWPMMGCAHPFNKMDILEDSEDSFLQKMEALLGYKPSSDFIKNQNPYAELDFSKAPKFDAIFLATLLYRRDFSGTVLARILKHHANKGTLVNIIGTGYMHGEKDKALLKELAKHKNIRVQEYKYHSPSPWPKLPGQYISNYLRDFHMKMLVGISKDIEKNNFFITGGRNVHDGFVFSSKPDFSKYPELNQFDAETPYAYWKDLEIKVESKQLSESIYAHMLKFWNRGIQNQHVMDISNARTLISAKEVIGSKTPMARHFLSVPFNDDHALEKLYIDLLDSAQENIKLSTPYLRPTRKLMKAIERAVDRGVDISIQTRIDLAGDTAAWLYEETNKAAINKLFERVKLYEWTQRSILHTKLITIDNKVAFFGSVNVSRRSFVQDIEHGLLINGESAVKRFNNLFEEYTAKSRVIDEKQSRKFWASMVIAILPNQF